MEQIGEGSAGRVHRGVRKSDQKEAADRNSWVWLGGEGGFLLGVGLGLLCRLFTFHLHNLPWIRLVSLSTFHVGDLGQLRLSTKRNRQIFSIFFSDEMITGMRDDRKRDPSWAREGVAS